MKNKNVIYYIRLFLPALLFLGIIWYFYSFSFALPAVFGMIILGFYNDRAMVLEWIMMEKHSTGKRLLILLENPVMYAIMGVTWIAYLCMHQYIFLLVVLAGFVVQTYWVPLLTFTTLGNYVNDLLFPNVSIRYVVHYSNSMDDEFRASTWFDVKDEAEDFFKEKINESELSIVVLVDTAAKKYKIGKGNLSIFPAIQEELTAFTVL